MCCLELVPLRGEKKFQAMSTKQDLGTYQAACVLFKISYEHPRPFYMGFLFTQTLYIHFK